MGRCAGNPTDASGPPVDCCSSENAQAPANDACCAGPCDEIDGSDCCGDSDTESCCGSADDSDGETTPLAEASLALKCCDSNEEHCDKNCIIAVAAVECEKACTESHEVSDGSAHDHDHDKDGHHGNSACSMHLAKAFEQYTAYLESARCICRAVIERGFPSLACCPGGAPATGTAGTMSRHAEEPSHAYTTAHGVGHHNHAGDKHRNHHHAQHTPGAHNHVKHRGAKHAHGNKAGHGTHSHSGDHDDAADRALEQAMKAAKEAQTLRDELRDIEKDTAHEQVTLVVSGMTCSGCGNKLERTLKAVPGVTMVRVNFVMGHAEFTLDSRLAKADEVVRSAERATGFSCTRMTSDDQELDIIASARDAKFLSEMSIPGMNDVTVIEKNLVRISYDPSVIGARTLMAAIRRPEDHLAPPRDDPSVSSGRKRLYDQLFKTIAAAVFTIPVLVLVWGDNLVSPKIRASVCIALATVVQLIAVPDFYKPAISALVRSGVLEMDMLVVISITAAYVYSIVAFGFRMAGRPLETSEFFETSTLLITLVLLGRLIAAFARVRAVSAVSLRSLQSASALVTTNGKDREIDSRLLQFGDVLKILPHVRIPTDALVFEGMSEVDESMLTGESVPVPKYPGSGVIAGTVNGSGLLLARLTRLPGKNTVTDIADLVEQATNSKPKVQDLADRIAGYFVPVVTVVAVLVTIIWIVVGLKVQDQPGGKAVADAITYAVAVLAVSCPCALGLAVPMVLVVAGGIAARAGVVIKSASCTEGARKVTDVVFDKTGTLTEEDLEVASNEIVGGDVNEVTSIVQALVADNKHPVSVAVAKYLAQNGCKPGVTVDDIHVIPGAGVEGAYNGSPVKAGSPAWTNTVNHPAVQRMADGGMSILCVTMGSALIAAYGLKTRMRAEAPYVISELKRRNITVHIVSGDHNKAVQMVADAMGIERAHVAAERTPAEKRAYVESLMSERKMVMFCGDGTNDAVAVAQADVGVQLGGSLSASDVTRGAADVVLLSGLKGIPFLIDLSKSSFRRMVFNFVWSGVYNVLAILLAAGAFVKFRIPPAYAGLGEIVSVLPVIFVASTMFLVKIKA